MIHDLSRAAEQRKVKFSIVCLSNNEKNVTSTRKYLRRVDTKDESEFLGLQKDYNEEQRYEIKRRNN